MSVRVGTTDRAITAFGGAELLREAARAVGLGDALDDAVQDSGRHEDGRHVCHPERLLQFGQSHPHSP